MRARLEETPLSLLSSPLLANFRHAGHAGQTLDSASLLGIGRGAPTCLARTSGHLDHAPQLAPGGSVPLPLPPAASRASSSAAQTCKMTAQVKAQVTAQVKAQVTTRMRTVIRYVQKRRSASQRVVRAWRSPNGGVSLVAVPYINDKTLQACAQQIDPRTCRGPRSSRFTTATAVFGYETL